MNEEEEREKLYTALHPTRFEILQRLVKTRSYASKLAEEMEFDPSLIRFHLSTLEKYGLIAGEFGLKNEPEERPVAVKYFTLTEQGKRIFSRATTCQRFE